MLFLLGASLLEPAAAVVPVLGNPVRTIAVVAATAAADAVLESDAAAAALVSKAPTVDPLCL